MEEWDDAFTVAEKVFGLGGAVFVLFGSSGKWPYRGEEVSILVDQVFATVAFCEARKTRYVQRGHSLYIFSHLACGSVWIKLK